MSFEIHLVEKETDSPPKPVLIFEESFYWFLWDFTEKFKERTKIIIDNYGVAYVKENDLKILKELIEREISRVKNLEQNLKACEGTDLSGKKLYIEFKRDDLIKFLNRVSELCGIAFKENKILAFEGD